MKSERDRYMLKDEYMKFINHCPKKYKLFWEIVFNAGLRVSEGINITSQDIIFNENKIVIRTLKRKNHPAIPVIVSHQLIESIGIYIGSNGIVGKLWNISRQFAWKMFKNTCVKAGLNSKYSPHALRHSHGVMIADITNGNMIQIKNRLRHASTKSTEFYLHVSEKKQKELSEQITDYLK